MRQHEVTHQTLRTTLLDPEEAGSIDVGASQPAGVLVGLYAQRGTLHAVFTKRRHDLSHHAGEISFPGGRHDHSDATLLATALRETHEELGLPPESVEVLGALEPIPTVVSGYAVYPFVGIVPTSFAWKPNPSEVAAVIDLPLDLLTAGYSRRRLMRLNTPIHTDTYVVGEHTIWGVTARIVSDLLDRTGRVAGAGRAGHLEASATSG